MAIRAATATFPRSGRAIARRTLGRTHGSVTRLMSPSDFGVLLKPFVFLDLFDHEGPPFNGPLHPHSGIATLTYIAQGAVSFRGRSLPARIPTTAGPDRTKVSGLLTSSPHSESGRPSGAPRFRTSGSACPVLVKESDTELRQCRSPCGGGPSGKT
jgi:hypothetical protein